MYAGSGAASGGTRDQNAVKTMLMRFQMRTKALGGWISGSLLCFLVKISENLVCVPRLGSPSSRVIQS